MKKVEDLTLTQIQEIVKSKKKGNLQAYNVLVFRNIMMEPIIPYLNYELLTLGLDLNFIIGEYDNALQESILNKEEIRNSDLMLVFLNIKTLSPILSNRFLECNSKELRIEIDRIKDYTRGIVENIRSESNQPIIFYGFETPVSRKLGILEDQGTGLELSIYYELNSHLKSFYEENVLFIDADRLIAGIGLANYIDDRYWHIGKAPFRKEALLAISSEIKKVVRATKGMSKKCLVLDCDNTLWGGIVSEDGIEGIKIGPSYPGSPYYEFQQEILSLRNRGVILALCSKNNEEEVIEVLNQHSGMLIKEEHISSHRINWQNKADNIREIAEELNIGLDSFVFIDDSSFEIELVNNALPQVSTMQVNPKRSVEYKKILESCGLFDTLSFSKEDKKRGEMYKSEVKRKRSATSTNSIEEYLESLGMKMKLAFCDESNIARVSQLTQRTNQFNLTTKRYTEGEIRQMLSSNDYRVIYFQLEDRFGDYGIVGLCILNITVTAFNIDTLLMSCRVLGRKVEDTLISEIELYAIGEGVHTINSSYVKTKKNKQVEDLFDRLGFSSTSVGSEEKNFTKSIDKFDYKSPIKVINAL